MIEVFVSAISQKKFTFAQKNASLAGSVLDERAIVQTDLCEARKREYRILYDSVLKGKFKVYHKSSL